MTDAITSVRGGDVPRGLVGLPYEARAIRTERLVLRRFVASDLDDVFGYQRREDVVRYLAWEALDRAGAARHLRERMAMSRIAAEGDWLVHAVESSEPAGEPTRVVGEIILIARSVPHGQLEIGWILDPLVQGRGIATEAARAVLALSFGRLGAHRVFAKLDPRNTASARLCERLGMRHEADFREEQSLKGEWTNSAVYGLLASEFRAPPDDTRRQLRDP